MLLLHKLIVVMVLVALSCPTLWCLRLSLIRLLCSWNSPGQNTGVGSHSVLQGVFPIQGLNLGLLYCMQILYCWSYQRSLRLRFNTILIKTPAGFFFFLESDKLIIKLIWNCKASRKIRTIFLKNNAWELKSI